MSDKTDKGDTPSRNTRPRQKVIPGSSKAEPGPVRGSSKTPKNKDQKSPKAKKIPLLRKEKSIEAGSSTPPKPGSSSLKMSISNSQISLDENMHPSSLDMLDASTSSGDTHNSSDPLDKLSEINSDELEDPVPLIEIPSDIRSEAGSNWRLKEAILNSFHFGTATIKASEFARSDSDLKTAEIVASKDHTLDSKKYRVKIHLGNRKY